VPTSTSSTERPIQSALIVGRLLCRPRSQRARLREQPTIPWIWQLIWFGMRNARAPVTKCRTRGASNAAKKVTPNYSKAIVLQFLFDARPPLPAALDRRGIGRLLCRHSKLCCNPVPIRSQALCTDGVSVLVSFSGSTKWGRFFCSTNAGAVAWRLVGE
jgi:hypothetical protein